MGLEMIEPKARLYSEEKLAVKNEGVRTEWEMG